jgi:hypothetical protein
MLEGEQKRREIALRWVAEIENILEPAAEDTWGGGVMYYDYDPTYTIDVTKIDKEGKKKETGIYYRYREHVGQTRVDGCGFYQNNGGEGNVWGASLNKLRGREFWYAIQCIIEWIPQVIDAMDKREESRQELLEKIRI